MKEQNFLTQNLTDEQILDEFVKRFKCDAAVLIYLDSSEEFGFARWQNSVGRKWAKNIFKLVKQEIELDSLHSELEYNSDISKSLITHY